MRQFLLVGPCVIALGIAGCGGTDAGDVAAKTADAPAGGGAAPAVPMEAGGYQVVRIVVRNAGYEPASIRLKAGVPAKLVFVQEADSHCAAQVQIPAFGVPVTDLPAGRETVVEVTPKEAGTFSFTCGMDMLRGTILVAS